MPASATFKLIIVYFAGYTANTAREDNPKCAFTTDPIVGEVPDGDGCHYLGLNAFQSELNLNSSPLLARIKARNEDVDDVQYLNLQLSKENIIEWDTERVLRHKFAVTITTAVDSPIKVTVFPSQVLGYEWVIDAESVAALYSLLNRIFWTPPTPPRIRGRFALESFEMTLNGQLITGSFTYPHPGGMSGPGGGG